MKQGDGDWVGSNKMRQASCDSKHSTSETDEFRLFGLFKARCELWQQAPHRLLIPFIPLHAIAKSAVGLLSSHILERGLYIDI